MVTQFGTSPFFLPEILNRIFARPVLAVIGKANNCSVLLQKCLLDITLFLIKHANIKAVQY